MCISHDHEQQNRVGLAQTLYLQVNNEKPVKQGSKNIPMLKDVGMTENKKKQMQYICRRRGKGSIYAARHGLRACITCVTPPYISLIMGLRMLLLLHGHIPCLAAYILHLFLYFLALSSQHFNGNVIYW